MGVNLNPFAKAPIDPYVVRIPINSQPVPAYQRVTREHLLGQGNVLSYQRVPPTATVGMSIVGMSDDGSHIESKVSAVRNDNNEVVFVVPDGREIRQANTMSLGGAFLNVNAIIGRVVKKDKRPGMGFTESTFFPQGTPEGIAGATPQGMRAVTLDATKISGVYALNAGDRIDLMASVPAEDAGTFQGTSNSSLPGAALIQSSSNKSDKKASAEPILIAQNAMVLKPVYVRNEATTSSSLTQGKKVQNVPKYEVAIAVAASDVIPLQTALNRGLEITSLTHSMQKGTEATTDEPEASSQLMAPVTVRAIPAYEVVNRDAFISPATRRIRLEPVTQQQIDRLGIVVSVDEALGAVARHDIPAGSFIRGSDLLSRPSDNLPEAGKTGKSASRAISSHHLASHRNHPNATLAAQPSPSATVVGDRPTITGFIPAGRFGFAIPWNLLYGAEHLQIDDRLDIVCSYQLEREQNRTTVTKSNGELVTTQHQEITSRGTDRTLNESLAKRGEPWTIATDAIVVGPVGFPAPAAAMRAIGDSKTSGAKTQSLTGPAIIFAVDSRDVEAISAALNSKDVQFYPIFRAKNQDDLLPGYKRIAVAPVELSAYELFSDLKWKGLRRDITTRLVRIDDDQFVDAISSEQIASYYGRVLRQGKLRFEHFTDADFLPTNAQPGTVAGLSSHSVAVPVSASQISGIGHFRDNDRIAILSNGRVALPANAVVHGGGSAEMESNVVVQDARILRGASDVSDTVTLELSIAEVANLQAALSGGNLTAVARSRQSGVPHQAAENSSSLIPSQSPLRSAKKLEALVGREKEWHIFRAAAQSAAP